MFHVLRNARLLDYKARPNLVVCWGGHSIVAAEYQYTKNVGYELGLRGLDVCTGCGPGAMKGPMKGATIGHAKQRIEHGRYIGITEPGIIAAEPPNPIVTQLAIMPDIEKRLEAFVRMAHGIVVFPGGAGTAEEILYLLGHPAGPGQPRAAASRSCSRGRRESAAYFEQIGRFSARHARGGGGARASPIIIDDPPEVARRMVRGMDAVREFRRRHSDSYNFNWLLSIRREFQQPFEVTHASHARARPAAATSRRTSWPRTCAAPSPASSPATSRKTGIQAIERARAVRARPAIPRSCSRWMSCWRAFVAQRRMRLPGSVYRPVYRLVA